MRRWLVALSALFSASAAMADTGITLFDKSGSGNYVQIQASSPTAASYRLLLPQSVGGLTQALSIQSISGSTYTLSFQSPGAGGASALAVSTGSASKSVIVSSPTSNVVFDSNTFVGSLQGLTSSFIQMNASSVTLQGNNLAVTYLTNSSATATYLQDSSATATYLQLSSATATYLTQSSATATYLQDSSATLNYIQNTSALQSGATFFVSSGTVNNLNVTYNVSAGSGTFFSSGTAVTAINVTAGGASGVDNGMVVTANGSGVDNRGGWFNATGTGGSTMNFAGEFTASGGGSANHAIYVNAGDIELGASVGSTGNVLQSQGANNIPSWTSSLSTNTTISGAPIILDTSTLQTGATFYVSSGTVSGQLTVGTLQGASLSTCGDGSHALSWTGGNFGCQALSGGGGASGQINSANQFSAPYYSVAGSSNVLSAYPGITLSTNTGISISTPILISSATTHSSSDTFNGLVQIATTSALIATNSSGVLVSTTVNLAAADVTGVLQAASFPALTGDVTTSAGSLATTAAALQNNITTFGASSVTINGSTLQKSTVTILSPTTSVYELILETSTTAGAQSIDVSTNDEIVVNGSTGTSGQFLSSQGPGLPVKWASGNVGTITGVTAGTGLTGGGSSGNVTLTIASTAAFTTSTQTWTGGNTFQSSSTFNGAVIISTSINASGQGSSGQFLESQGPGQPVIWGTASGGGASTLAVTTGTSAGFSSIASSPTAVLNFDNTHFSSILTGSATNFTSLLSTQTFSSMTITNNFNINGSSAGAINLTEGASSGAPASTAGNDIFWADSSSHAVSATFNGSASTYTIASSSLTPTSGQCASWTSGGANAWTLGNTACITGNQTITLSGDVSGTGTTSISVTNAALQNHITTFGSSITVNGAGGELVKYQLNAGSMTGAGLTSCSGASNAVTWNSSTDLFGCNTISGGGASTLAVAYGSSVTWKTQISSPTAAISFDQSQFGSSLANGSTAFITISYSSNVQTGNYSYVSTDTVVEANCSSACTMTLPNATTSFSGKIYKLKIIGTGVATLATTASQTIDGSSTVTPNPNQWADIEVRCTGSNWEID